MPRRPREHVIEDLARTQLHQVFARAGWTCEDLDKDYGEDLLVRIFEQGTATPWSFFVQSKATESLDRYLTKDRGNISFPVRSSHLEHWDRFWEPVILAVYDANTQTTYWEVIQTYLESIGKSDSSKTRKSVSVRVPTNNLLDAEGLQRLRNRTKNRYKRFEAQKEGAKILIDELRNQWGVDIDYGPEIGFLMLPKGEFKPDPSGGSTCRAFGQLAAQLANLKEKYGIDPQEATEDALDLMHQVVTAYKGGSILQVRDKNGNVIEEWMTFKDLLRHLRRLEELENM